MKVNRFLAIVFMGCMFILTANMDAQQHTPNRNDSLCNAFNILNNKIRDGLIHKKDALQQLQTLLPEIKAYYYQHNGRDYTPKDYVFPLAGYNYHAIGGSNGSGYIASGYDYFDGNKHGGHPAHDIFIKDNNQDCIDDNTHQSVTVCAVTGGIVIATENNWDPQSTQRGGNYVWVYDPGGKKLWYYAHNSKVLVKPGDILQPGDMIAKVGRTGANAIKKRSPTHLHLMELTLDSNYYPKPMNCYNELKAMTH